MYRKVPASVPDAPPRVPAPLNADDLDADIVQSLHDTVSRLVAASATTATATTGASEKNEPSPAALARDTALQKWLKTAFKLPLGWRIAGQTAGWTLWLSVLWLFVVVIGALGDAFSWITVLYPLLAIASGCATVTLANKKQKRWKTDQTLTPQVMARILPLVDRESSMEATYCDALAALLKHQAAWGPGALADILRDLKSLLETGKQTHARRAEIEQAMSHQSIADAEAEAVRLAARVDAATDPSARETFRQSLLLMEARLTRAKSLEPLRQQLEAQEEVIAQSLAEAQSALSGASLAQWAFAPTSEAAGTTSVAGLPLPHLGDTVSRLRQQTESVEQAVREVMAVQTVGGTGR